MAVVVNSDASAFKRSANAPGQTSYSIWGWFYFTSVTPARFWGPLGIYAGSDGAPTGSTQFHQITSASSGSANIELGYDGPAGFVGVSLHTASANTWYFYALTCSALTSGSLKAYVRAITANSFTTATNSSTSDTWTPARVEWGRDTFSGDYIDGRIHACGMADVALSDEELLELSYFHEPQLDGIRSLNVFYPCIESTNSNATIDRSGNGRNATATVGALADSPPLLWKAIGPQIVLPTAASGAAYTLDADSGSFVLTGTDAGLLADRQIIAGSGSFTLTGTDATLQHGYTLDADSASFVLTGTDAALERTRVLTAESGTFTLTGTAAGLLADRTLSADSGSFSYTGAAAGLLADRLLGADSGAYTLTGADVSLEYTPNEGAYVLDAESATFVLSGTDAALEYGANQIITDTTGGWASFLRYEQDRERRRRKRREMEEAEEAIKEIAEPVTREIAQILHKQERQDERKADLERLRALVNEFPKDLPPRVTSAIERAQTRQTISALMNLDRELRRYLEDEEVAVMMLLLND